MRNFRLFNSRGEFLRIYIEEDSESNNCSKAIIVKNCFVSDPLWLDNDSKAFVNGDKMKLMFNLEWLIFHYYIGQK